MIGNKFLTLLSNMFTQPRNLTDMETCYKVFRRDVLQKIRIEEDRFGFEPEITAKVSKLGVVIYEVGISYYGRTYAEGKKIGWKDGFRAIWAIPEIQHLQIRGHERKPDKLSGFLLRRRRAPGRRPAPPAGSFCRAGMAMASRSAMMTRRSSPPPA